MSQPLAGRHAFVTGAGRGIGAAIATALARDGARLTLLGRDEAALHAHAARLPQRAQPEVVVGDVTDEAALARAFTQGRARHGEVAILVNNAGGARSERFTALERAAWDEMVALNMTSVYACCRAVLPAMLAARSGRIVTIASTAGLVGGAYIAAYTAAKHGAVGLTRALAAEVAKDGITVNAVCPGFTETALLDRALERISATTGRTRDGASAVLLARNPLGRFVRPEEVAETVAWLCRDEAAAITGQAIVIDGGEVQR